MKPTKSYTEKELLSGMKYIMSVCEWVKVAYGEKVAEDWIKGGFSDPKYMVEYNEAYESFINKIFRLRKDQKEAMEEIMLTKVYLRIREKAAYERLDRKLSELEKY